MTSRDPIAGVSVTFPKRVVNEKGFLQEIYQTAEGHFPVAQSYMTSTRAGITRAWYKHRKQWDALFPLAGRLTLVLIDDRADSATFGRLNDFVLDASEPAVVRFPPGIWHGFRPIGTDILLLHLTSDAFVLDEPDEVRLPPDAPGIPYVWAR